MVQLLNRKQSALLASFLIVLLIGIPTIGHLPIHRTNIQYSDPLGDVSDPDFDVIEIRSYIRFQNIILELTVAGTIQTPDTWSSYSDFIYRINVVARGINRAAHIYSCAYQNGVVDQYGFDVEVANSTLRIFFPMTAFISDSYMIGLEGVAQSPFEDDLTPEDRDSNIARLLF
ncbi:MAG: hypothetical protein ACFFE2_12565 [Candidatus Thorarchaeota archaeon]